MGIIRIILALSVVMWHAPGQHLRLLNAGVAVLMFFIVSGFYMALVVNEKYAPGGPGWVRRFYTARFLRLYPAYAAMLLVMVGWFWWSGSPNVFTFRLAMPGMEQAVLAALNITVIGQDLYELMNHIAAEPVRRLFSPEFFKGWVLVGQAWSLSVEIFFYLLVPLVVRSPVRLVALLAASLAIRAFLIGGLGFESGVWGYWFTPATMCMFTMGSLSYSLYRAVKSYRWAAPAGWLALALMMSWLCWLVLAYGAALPVDASDSIDQPRFWLAYLSFATAVPFVFLATKRGAIDRVIGDLSYPLYLVHGLVLGFIYNRWGYSKESVGIYALAILAAIVAAILLRAIEIVIDRIRKVDLAEPRVAVARP